MPDPFQYTMALMAAFAVSFLAVAGTRRFFQRQTCWAVDVIEVIAVVAGLATGFRVLQFDWVWPPVNAINRFLTLVLPVAVIVELIAGLASVPNFSEARRLKGPGLLSMLPMVLRVVLFASVGRVLLHNSVYLSMSPGVEGMWSSRQFYLFLTGSTLLLASTWWLLTSLARRSGPGSVVASLSLSLMTAGISIMLAGYIKGGVAALPFAASLIGVLAIFPFFRQDERVAHGRNAQGMIGLGLMALFSLLWIGCFFGQLPVVDSVVIFVAPVLCWGSELPLFRRMNSRRKVLLRLAVVATPLMVQLFLAKGKFDQKLAPLLAKAVGALEVVSDHNSS